MRAPTATKGITGVFEKKRFLRLDLGVPEAAIGGVL